MKLFITLCFALLVSIGVKSQNIDTLFKSMPDSLIVNISATNRALLVVDTAKVTIPHELGDIKKLKQNDTFLHIKTSDAGDMQIKILPLVNDSKIICVIKTVCAPACDSRVWFYTTDWQEIDPGTLLPKISPELFIDSAKKSDDNYYFALSLPSFSPISAEFIDGKDELSFKYNYSVVMSTTDADELKPFIKSDTVTLKWNKTRFQ